MSPWKPRLTGLSTQPAVPGNVHSLTSDSTPARGSLPRGPADGKSAVNHISLFFCQSSAPTYLPARRPHVLTSRGCRTAERDRGASAHLSRRRRQVSQPSVCQRRVPHTGCGDAPVVALFSGVTPGIMAVPAGGGSALVKGSPAVSQLPYTSLSAFCAPACSSSATPTHHVEVRIKTEGLEEGAAAQRVDGGVGLDVLATQGWQSVCQSAPRRWVR